MSETTREQGFFEGYVPTSTAGRWKGGNIPATGAVCLQAAAEGPAAAGGSGPVRPTSWCRGRSGERFGAEPLALACACHYIVRKSCPLTVLRPLAAARLAACPMYQ